MQLRTNPALAYILTSVVCGAIGQVLLKKGMATMGPVTIAVSRLPAILLGIATNPFVVVGLLIYVSGTLFWLAALSRVDLSFAYPFASLSYVLMLAAAWFLFSENISWMRILGTVVVALGVVLISRS